MSPETEVPATWRLREDRDEIGLAQEALTDPQATERERYLADPWAVAQAIAGVIDSELTA